MINYFYPKTKLKEFEKKIKFVSKKMNLNKWISLTTTIGFALFCLTGIITYLLKLETINLIYFFFTSFFITAVFNYFLFDYLFEQKKTKLESFIPDMLLTASIFSTHNTIEEIISFIAKENYGLLSEEFSKAKNEISKGENIETALTNISKRINSPTLTRTINLLVWGYKSGVNTSELFNETAEDILETKAILNERNATTLIEKYTLLIAGGILVPLILGLIVKMVLNLNIPTIEGFELGLTQTKRIALLNAALTSNQLYIIEFSFISSYFIALMEGNQKKVILYSLFLVPLSFIVYNLIQFFL